MRLFYFLMSVGLSCQFYNDQTKYYGRYPDIQTSTKVPRTVRRNPLYNDRYGRYPDIQTSTKVPRTVRRNPLYNDRYGRYPDISTWKTGPTKVRGNPAYNDNYEYYGWYPDLSTSYMTTVPQVPNIVCDGSWDSSFQFKLSPGKNGTSEYVSQVLGNIFYSLSDGDIAAIQPIAEQHFDIQSENGQVMVKNKLNGEKVSCGTFKNFILERFDRNQIQNGSKDQNDLWNIGCWMERWTYILPGAFNPPSTLPFNPTSLQPSPSTQPQLNRRKYRQLEWSYNCNQPGWKPARQQWPSPSGR